MFAISFGNGKVDSSDSEPNNLASIAANFSASTLVESITKVDVGLWPSTGTGTVETSQLNVTASGLSFIVAKAFSEGAALAPYIIWILYPKSCPWTSLQKWECRTDK